MVVNLQTIYLIVGHHFRNNVEQKLLHFRVKGIQPDSGMAAFLIKAGGGRVALFLGQPVGVAQS
jgi:hypothetical protein